MRTVAFVAPFSLPTTRRFLSALAKLSDVRVIGMLQEEPTEPLGVEVFRCADVLDSGPRS